MRRSALGLGFALVIGLTGLGTSTVAVAQVQSRPADAPIVTADR
jgi:hypothetical protein